MFDSFRILFSLDISRGVILIILTSTASLPKGGLMYPCHPYRFEVYKLTWKSYPGPCFIKSL